MEPKSVLLSFTTDVLKYYLRTDFMFSIALLCLPHNSDSTIEYTFYITPVHARPPLSLPMHHRSQKIALI